jgi:hypothetical protein
LSSCNSGLVNAGLRGNRYAAVTYPNRRSQIVIDGGEGQLMKYEAPVPVRIELSRNGKFEVFQILAPSSKHPGALDIRVTSWANVFRPCGAGVLESAWNPTLAHRTRKSGAASMGSARGQECPCHTECPRYTGGFLKLDESCQAPFCGISGKVVQNARDIKLENTSGWVG